MYRVLIIFHFSLEDKITVLIVTVPFHCLIAYLLHYITIFWSIKAFSKFKEEYNVAGRIILYEVKQYDMSEACNIDLIDLTYPLLCY